MAETGSERSSRDAAGGRSLHGDTGGLSVLNGDREVKLEFSLADTAVVASAKFMELPVPHGGGRVLNIEAQLVMVLLLRVTRELVVKIGDESLKLSGEKSVSVFLDFGVQSSN